MFRSRTVLDINMKAADMDLKSGMEAISIEPLRRAKAWLWARREFHMADLIFALILRFLSWGLILLFIGIFGLLLQMSWPAIKQLGFQFFVLNDWNPPMESFGARAFLVGTLLTSLMALLIAGPISIGVALFLTEIVGTRFRLGNILGFLVEMLAAIPSVVYGLWGIFVLAPLMLNYVEPWLITHLGTESPLGLRLFASPSYGYGLFTSSLVLALMITPTISSVCREVFKSVPASIREGALALGATRWEMIRTAVVGSSLSGISGGLVLGLGRALGETMAVTMVIGNRNDIPQSLLSPAQTMASVIANEYAEASGLHLSALAAIGLLLLSVSLVINFAARIMIWRVEGGRRNK